MPLDHDQYSDKILKYNFAQTGVGKIEEDKPNLNYEAEDTFGVTVSTSMTFSSHACPEGFEIDTSVAQELQANLQGKIPEGL